MNYKIEVAPSKDQLEEIKLWLTQEDLEQSEGFACNWNIIQKYFDENKLIILIHNQRPIGFTTWRIYNSFLSNIDIAEIHPHFRSIGAGEFMMTETFKYLATKGVKVIELFCEPRSSEVFWRKLGFRDVESNSAMHDLTLFKPLIDVLETKVDPNARHIIELWDCVPYQASDSSPKWSWSVDLEDGKLPLPVLVSGNSDWNICWTQNGEVVKESKVKYFSREHSIDNSGYIYITKLMHP